MFIKLNNDLKFNLKIDKNNNDNDIYNVNYNCYLKDVIGYMSNSDYITKEELINFKDTLYNHLNDKVNNNYLGYFNNSDLEFKFYNKDDIKLEIRINLWSNEYFSYNYINTILDKKDIEYLYTYLSIITNSINISNNKATNLINKGIIYKECY